ncbi:MAG: hypothetical protein ACJAXI_000298 [Crocinitomicaceae bacterium]|jgi:hypothetical protein
MKSSYIYLILGVLTISLFSACSKTPTPNFHQAYFGMEAGRYVIYDVVEIKHDKALEQHDTLYYQLKTKWDKTYIDDEGRNGREFLRFTRASSTGTWTLQDKWHGLIDGIRAELIDENQRKVKLVFSPTFYKQWNANAANADGEKDRYYSKLHSDTTINGVYMDSTLTVTTYFPPNGIRDYEDYEIYAKGIGLVYKHFKYNNFFQIQFDGEENEVDEGNELYYHFIESGIE